MLKDRKIFFIFMFVKNEQDNLHKHSRKLNLNWWTCLRSDGGINHMFRLSFCLKSRSEVHMVCSGR